MLWRLWSRPDRRFVVAALGIAAAILLPIAGTLVLQGLDVRVEDGAWMAYRVDGGELPEGLRATSAVRFETQDGVEVAAYVVGDPLVRVDQSANDPVGVRAETITLDTPLVGVVLVHPDTLTGSAPHVALLREHTNIPGAVVAPARGSDAFELAGLDALQNQTILLVLASVPAVALVAVAFGDHEARQRARTAATLAALGRPALARRILGLRFVWLMTWAVGFATAIGYLLWRFGGAAFHPEDAKPLGIAAAIAVPALLGGIIGLVWAVRRLGDGEERLRVPPAENDVPGARIGWLPVIMRPLALGTRLLPLLLVAGILFGINLGFPLAAASVPAAIAGGPGEWVVGSDGGISFGGSANARPAAVMALDPAIDAIVAERLLPTLMNGAPVIIRGGDLTGLADYHGARGVGTNGLWLGDRLADRLGLQPGDAVRVQGAAPMVATLTVAGLFQGGGVLQDEALLDDDAAGALTGHEPGRATVLRMRPDTEEARAALGRGQASIEVLSIRTDGTPTSGAPFTITIDTVNLGGSAGTRELPVRINGIVQAVPVASLAAYGRATVAATVIAPIGPFSIEVNPTTGVTPNNAASDLVTPRIVFLPDAITVRSDDPGTVALRNATGLVDQATFTDGEARLQATAPGRYQVTQGDVTRTVIVSPDAYRNQTTLRVDALWTTPHQPRVGEKATLHIALTNHGASGEGTVELTLADGPTPAYARLLAGQSSVIELAFTRSAGLDRITGGDKAITLVSPASAVPLKIDAERSAAVQSQVADRVLGDAQKALMGLASISLASILSVVYLGTERTLDGRAHVPRVLHALGMAPEQVRYRASWEAAVMAGLCFLISALVAKGVFRFLGAIGWPLPFAHTLPDPIGWLFVLQAGTAFAGAAALAAYMGAGRILSGRP